MPRNRPHGNGRLFELLAEGLSMKQVADALKITKYTVALHEYDGDAEVANQIQRRAGAVRDQTQHHFGLTKAIFPHHYYFYVYPAVESRTKWMQDCRFTASTTRRRLRIYASLNLAPTLQT